MLRLRLTDEQLRQVREIAAPLTPFQRGPFLRAFADRLGVLEQPMHGDGTVYRAALEARRDVQQRKRA